MTSYEFIKKAREVHGYKYIYPILPSKITHKDKISIIYNDILYEQSVSKHLMGRCPEKNTPSKTTEQFIKESKEVWGDKYDYSLVEYRGALKKVKIIYDGVIFEQVAISHLKGLSPEANMNLNSFIKRSIKRWGDKYDYSLVDYKNCKEKVKIIYKKTGEIFEQTPFGHLNGSPENIVLSKKKTIEEFISESIKIHGDKYDYSLVEYISNQEKVNIICKKHGIFKQTPLSHIVNKSGCRKCGYENTATKNKNTKVKKEGYKIKYLKEDFISDSILKWGNKYDYSLVEYVDSKTKVKIIYDDIIYEQRPNLHLKYPPERFMNQEIFLIKAKRKWGDKYDYSLVEYVSTKHLVKIIYEGEVFEQYPHNHFIYAPELRNKLTTEDFISKAKEIHNNKYTYDDVVYINDRTNVNIKCPTHGYFLQKPNIHLRGSGCKRCSESFGEKAVAKFLDKYKIHYQREYKFKDCRNKLPLPFDFYIPSIRTCIEFDGIQHYQPIEHFGGIDAYEKLKENDKIKSDYCEENYINLIKIKWYQVDDIETILYENLKNTIKLKSNSLYKRHQHY
jgi:hypothetical protein